MKYKAEIDIMPLPELLDPQGKAVLQGLIHLNLTGISGIRIGKHIAMEVDAEDDSTARQKVETACKKLLANPVMENFRFEIKKVAEASSL